MPRRVAEAYRIARAGKSYLDGPGIAPARIGGAIAAPFDTVPTAGELEVNRERQPARDGFMLK